MYFSIYAVIVIALQMLFSLGHTRDTGSQDGLSSLDLADYWGVSE